MNDNSIKLYKTLNKEERKLFDSIKWLKLFSFNGWEWIANYETENEGLWNYKMTLLSDMYDCTIVAFVSEDFDGTDICGDIGINWLECTYEYERKSYAIYDLEDMMGGIRKAEVNLVKLGVPFTADYTFHQLSKKDNYNLKRANLKNRKKLKCDDVANLCNIACERVKNNGK